MNQVLPRKIARNLAGVLLCVTKVIGNREDVSYAVKRKRQVETRGGQHVGDGCFEE